MEKFLFLDIDDVLVTTRQHFSKKLHPKFQTNPFDQKCVRVLNSIIETENPIIILSSDWKLRFSIDDLNEIFHDNGVMGKISDITPNLWKVEFKSLSELEICRATEILKFVSENNVQNFVAVDDLNLFQWLPNNFVRCTHSMEGIKQSNVKEKILKIFNNV